MFSLSVSYADILFFICIFGFPVGILILAVRVVLSKFNIVKVEYNRKRFFTELIVLMLFGCVLVVIMFFVAIALSQ